MTTGITKGVSTQQNSQGAKKTLSRRHRIGKFTFVQGGEKGTRGRTWTYVETEGERVCDWSRTRLEKKDFKKKKGRKKEKKRDVKRSGSKGQ